MSYGFEPYLLDLDRLRSVVGSKDQGKIEEIEARFAGELDDLDQAFDARIAAGSLTARFALEELICGVLTDLDRSRFMYVYAFRILCASIGRLLPNDRLDSLTSRGRDVLRPLVDRVLATRPPLLGGLALDTTEIPEVGFMEPGDARAALDDSERRSAADADPSVRAAWQQYQGWLRTCEAEEKPIVVFYF